MSVRQSRSPRLAITYKGQRYAVTRRPDLAMMGQVPWCVRVAGGWYRVGTSATDATDDAGRFFRERMRNASDPRTPSFVASAKFPLLLSIEHVVVAAWPAFVPRGKGAKTYIQPALGWRVATTKGPVWMFQTASLGPSACGTADPQQSVADVKDLATIWVRSSLFPSPSES